MIGCAEPCPLEVSGQNTYQTPVVDNDEWVCRTVRPKDYNATGRLKPSFVHMKELRAGQLSSFRLAHIEGLRDLASRIPDKMNGVVPQNVVAVRASRLRGIQIDNLRALCVINDTRVNEHGAHDDEHIALSPCQRFIELGEDDREGVAVELRNQIILAYFLDGTSLHAV